MHFLLINYIGSLLLLGDFKGEHGEFGQVSGLLDIANSLGKFVVIVLETCRLLIGVEFGANTGKLV